LNEIYSCTPATNTVMVMENVSCKEGEEAQYITDVYSELISSALMVEGSHYFMRADTFHRTVPQTKAVTFLHRNSIVKPYARVVRHRDLERVCPFANKMEESAIWDTIEDCLNDKAGYHLTEIEKGELGHPSKIVEEARELLDAHQQGSRIMAAVELSDLYGAMRAYMVDHSGGLTFEDLDTMSKITERAFRNGRR
jgi:phosphoribosyl-ATP pyrophosphohydrolase